jgi:hypothetical protein
VFGTVIPQRCYLEAATTGVVPTPTAEERGDPMQGGHSMLIVGYDNTERMFIVRNSWGEEWGDHGYCKIPFDVMDACSRAEDFWVIAELAKETGFHLVRPGGTTVTSRPASSQRGGLAATTATMRDQIRSSLDADLATSSRKIDALLSGKTDAARQRDVFKTVLPCTACAGSGICAFCHGRNPGCVQCGGTGACSECGGTGVL